MVCRTPLDLGIDGLTPASARAIAASPQLAKLTSLKLAGNGLGAEGVVALAASPYLGGLALLDVSGNALGKDGAKALAGAPQLANLKFLAASSNRLGTTGARALAASKHVHALRVLELGLNGLSDKDVEVLMKSPVLARCHGEDRRLARAPRWHAPPAPDGASSHDRTRHVSAEPFLQRAASGFLFPKGLVEPTVSPARLRSSVAIVCLVRAPSSRSRLARRR